MRLELFDNNAFKYLVVERSGRLKSGKKVVAGVGFEPTTSGFITKYQAVERIIGHLKLIFIAWKSHQASLLN
jgi:hypothetical protein